MTDTQRKQAIQAALIAFNGGTLGENARALFATLGYRSEKRLDLTPNTPPTFLNTFDQNRQLDQTQALFDHWRSVDFLFQLTDDEVRLSSKGKFDNAIIESYLLFAIELTGDHYTRSQLASITRAVNRLFEMPALLLFKHGATLTLAVIKRRLHKRDESKDVLEKVTLIKDIRFAEPHRAHLEILADLTLPQIIADHGVRNWVELHRAWLKTLDSAELNKRFYQEIANWYFWAIKQVVFPTGAGADEPVRNATSVIRLITRLIFVWFIKEKGLVPDALFQQHTLKNLLKEFDPDQSTYYKAILQNLFFATLNTEMNSVEKPENRKFRSKNKSATGLDPHYGIHNLFRYEDAFHDPAAALHLFVNIPFLNGGLFECLDKEIEKEGKRKMRLVDSFSDRPENPLRVPNRLFFAPEQEVDLNADYGTSNKRYKVRGLIEIFQRYKFTVEENTPIEEEIALDPELLGKVFENLLAAYNPETGATARKQTGSFYTPREIVDYMVDEALITHLETQVVQASSLSSPTQETEPETQAMASTTKDDWTIFLNPNLPIEIYQRNLPHWRQKGVAYFVTFRLADSLPKQKLEQLRMEREEWFRKHHPPYSKMEQAEYHRLFSKRVQDWLDAGEGACHLSNIQAAQIVADALRFFDGTRYRLGAWVVMPNHVHVVVTPLGEYELSGITHSWKSFTANKINRLLGRSGAFWMEESYDHIVRNPEQLYQIEQYIINNPSRANVTVSQASSLNQEPPRQDAWVTVNDRLRQLFAYNNEPHQFTLGEVELLIDAIDRIKILDPACGSGAFPMGILHKLVFILAKLDPRNERWKAVQLQKVDAAIAATNQIAISIARDAAVNELETQKEAIEESFARNELDYARKLYLIENCIYGVDIQPIAVQIAKLRFFISLIVNQRVDDRRPNRGVIPLPNLETRFVAANTLLGLDRPLRKPAVTSQPTAPKLSQQVKVKADELKDVLRQYLKVQNPRSKERWLEEGRTVCAELNELLTAFPGIAPFNADWLFATASGPEAIDAWLPGVDDKPQPVAQAFRNEQIEKLEQDLADVRQRHFEARTPKTKERYRQKDADLRQQLAALLAKDGWPADQANRLATWNPYDQNAHADFFDPEWMFSVSEGFDVVIGNPPYVRQEQIKQYKPLFQKQYVCYTGTADLYVYFFELGIRLLREQGVLTYICSNKYFRAAYGEKLRAFLSNQTTLRQLIDFGDAPVFTAIAYPSIIVTSKIPARTNHVRILNWEMGPPIAEFAEIFQQNSTAIAQEKLDDKGWQLEAPEVLRLLEKLRKIGKPLGEYVNGRFYRGITTGFNEAFVIDRTTRDRLIAEHPSSAELLKPYLRGRDVKRWRVESQNLWLLFIPWHFPLHLESTIKGVSIEAEREFQKQYPAIYRHLSRFKEELSNRNKDETGIRYEWYALQRFGAEYWQEFGKSKIVIPAITDTVAYAPDFEGYYSNDKTSICVTEEVNYLLGLLNSKVLWWFIQQTAASRQGGFYEFKPMYVSKLPIPIGINRRPIETLVERILTAKRADSTADVSALEAEIDQLVYQLYGLTEDEIAIVERR